MFAWVKVVTPNRLDVAPRVGLPKRGVLKAFDASARRSTFKRSVLKVLEMERSDIGGFQTRTVPHWGFGTVSRVNGF